MVSIGAKSDKGLVRGINEDYYKILSGYEGIPVSLIIADGMGGHNSGEVASRLAVESVSSSILKSYNPYKDDYDTKNFINEIMKKANREVFERARENEADFGMGTTMIVAVFDRSKLFIGHVGDSRAYLIKNNTIKQLTTDHSYIQELIKNGSITKEEAEHHPRKNLITRALGCSEEVEIDTYVYDFKTGDTLMLCTDGLCNMLTEEEMVYVIESFKDPQAVCEELIERANENGGGDNITVIVFNI